MSDKSKRGPLHRTEKVKRPKCPKAVPQTAVAEAEDPRGKFLFCMGKKVRLIKCEHYELPPSLEYTPDGQPANFLRHSCTLEVETVPPNRFVRSMVYYILKAAIQTLPSGKLSIPEWATPYEIKLGVVSDVYGGEWMMESYGEEIIEEAKESPDQPTDLSARAQQQASTRRTSLSAPSNTSLTPFSKKQLDARREGGKARALIDKEDESKILARWSQCSKHMSKSRKGSIVAKWCKAEGVFRKNGEEISSRNITELVCRKIDKKTSR